MFTRNSFNVLYTKDIQKTYQFYNSLDLEISDLSDDKVVVTFGSFDLHFVLHTTEPFEAYKYIANFSENNQGIIFYIETTDIVEAAKLIPLAGGIIKAPVFDNLWECKELLFQDPNGYNFALYQEAI